MPRKKKIVKKPKETPPNIAVSSPSEAPKSEDEIELEILLSAKTELEKRGIGEIAALYAAIENIKQKIAGKNQF